MPHTKQAIKRVRTSLIRKQINKRFNTGWKNARKSFITLKDHASFQILQKKVDKAVSKGVIHKNHGARIKTRMYKHLYVSKS
jgi:small subunit ribosomal protein S20